MVQEAQKKSNFYFYTTSLWDASDLNDTVVILPDEKVAELDLFFEADGHYFWDEAKTADYQPYVDQYNRIAKKIGFRPTQVMLVCLDVLEETCHQLSEAYSNLTVLNQHMFRNAIVKLFENSFGEIEPQESVNNNQPSK